MITVETFAPVVVPINWQSELIDDGEQRFAILEKYFGDINGVNISECPWPMGYGSLAHDNLPTLYQPAGIFELTELLAEPDVSKAQLYAYDNCLAVLHISLAVNADLATIDDFQVTKRIEALSTTYLAPVLSNLIQRKVSTPLITPKSYRFFVGEQQDMMCARPLWVARMMIRADELTTEHYQKWLTSVDSSSAHLLLGSGNSLLVNPKNYDDMCRIMIMAQFHSALMSRIEEQLKHSLKQFNIKHYSKRKLNSLGRHIDDQQYRNDHIEFIEIQLSTAASGVQGVRRDLFTQFSQAWGFEEQRRRVVQLTNLTQARLERLAQEKVRQQNRSIQTLLMFLGALGLVSLVVDLINIEGDTVHSESIGLLDIIQLASTEHLLNFTLILIIGLTLYFHGNHE